jgi:multimeric flavodoxin WrbA
MKTLLIVFHSTTGGTRQMVDAAGAGAAEFDDVAVRLRHASAATAADILAADAYLFATPEMLGSMAGLMKDFFDRTYYAALDQVAGRPFGAMICAGSDGSGAARQLTRITTGWRLRPVAPPLIVSTHAQSAAAILAPKCLSAASLAPCRTLGGTLAGVLALGG